MSKGDGQGWTIAGFFLTMVGTVLSAIGGSKKQAKIIDQKVTEKLAGVVVNQQNAA